MSISFHLLNIISILFFDHRFYAPFACIVFDDTHFGIGNKSHFKLWKWFDKRKKLQQNCSHFFSLSHEMRMKFSFYFFFFSSSLPKTGIYLYYTCWTLVFVAIFFFRHNKMYGKIHLHIRHMRLFWLENKIAVTNKIQSSQTKTKQQQQ